MRGVHHVLCRRLADLAGMAIASAGWMSKEMLEYYDRAHASIRRNASHRLASYLREE